METNGIHLRNWIHSVRTTTSVTDLYHQSRWMGIGHIFSVLLETGVLQQTASTPERQLGYSANDCRDRGFSAACPWPIMTNDKKYIDKIFEITYKLINYYISWKKLSRMKNNVRLSRIIYNPRIHKIGTFSFIIWT